MLNNAYTKIYALSAIIPRHALHEKGLQRQIGVGTLVCSQEWRAAVVPRINRLSTAYQPLVNRGLCSPNGLHRNSLSRASENMFRTIVFDALEGTRDGCVLRQQTRRRPTLPGPPRPAAPPCATRPYPPVVCPGFGFDKQVVNKLCLYQAMMRRSCSHRTFLEQTSH